MTSINDLISGFLLECDISDRSRIEYRKIITGFYRYLSTSGIDPLHFTKADFWKYKRQMQTNLKERTSNMYVVTVRKYVNWLYENKHIEFSIEKLRMTRVKKTFAKEPLTQAEVHRLLSFRERTLKDRRDKMLIRLLLATGLRISEATNMRVSDVVTKKRQHYLMIIPKGRLKPIEFGIPTSTFQALQQWITDNRLKKDDYLLFSTADRKRPMAMSSVSAIIKNRMLRVGITSALKSAHSLRHTFAIELLKNGFSIYDVKCALRHANINTTEIYTRDYDTFIIRDTKFLNRIDKVVSGSNYKIFNLLSG